MKRLLLLVALMFISTTMFAQEKDKKTILKEDKETIKADKAEIKKDADKMKKQKFSTENTSRFFSFVAKFLLLFTITYDAVKSGSQYRINTS